MNLELRLACATLLFATVGIAGAAHAADAGAQWDLTELYATPQAWSDAYQRTRTTVSTLDRYKGTLGTSADTMLAALASISDTRKEVSRLFVYAALRSDEDLRDAPTSNAASLRARSSPSLRRRPRGSRRRCRRSANRRCSRSSRSRRR